MVGMGDAVVGIVLDGRYEIVERIAQGGMATVYVGLDRRLERQVAVKVMHAHLAEDPGFVARFHREARAAARITHPNVVAVYDQGQDAGHVFLVMELVAGRTLRALLREHGSLPSDRALALLEPIAAALSAAHAQGIVHRDVKPENVLLGDDGRVLVADFGLARAIETSALTQTTGLLLGTVAYLSPEQVRSGNADARSDVYAAGVTLFEMVTGSAPFTGDTPLSVAYQHTHDDIPAPSSVRAGTPTVVDELVRATTAREPDERLKDGAALLDSVRRTRRAIATGIGSATIALPREDQQTIALGAPGLPVAPAAPARAPRPSRGEAREARRREKHVAAGFAPRAPRPPRRSWRQRRGLIIAIVLVVLTVIAGTGGWWFGYARYSREPGVHGLSQTAAIARLQQAHLHPVVAADGAYSDDVDKGSVVRQSPGEGARVTDGQTVTLTLSLGPQLFPVPLIAPGTTTDAAKAALAAVNLKSAHGTDVYDPTIPKGFVVATDPVAGQQLRAGTTVKLILSRGPEPVTLPDAANANPDDLEKQLTDAKLKVVRKEESSDTVDEGKVTRLDPPSGKQLLPGKTVTMYVSTGKPFVDLPDVRGERLDDAASQLSALGFDVKTYSVFGDTVTEMSPGPGQVRKGSEVRLLAGF